MTGAYNFEDILFKYRVPLFPRPGLPCARQKKSDPDIGSLEKPDPRYGKKKDPKYKNSDTRKYRTPI